MSDDKQKQWLTAGEASRILHMSERQVNRYGSEPKGNPRLRTNRAGRRVLYLAEDVYGLADELRVDIKPAPQQRSTALMPPELMRYLQEQEAQMRRQGETQESIDRRLAEIERRLSEPPSPQPVPQVVIPTWLQAAIVVLVVLALVIIGLQLGLRP
jgi:hypothetical protein